MNLRLLFVSIFLIECGRYEEGGGRREEGGGRREEGGGRREEGGGGEEEGRKEEGGRGRVTERKREKGNKEEKETRTQFYNQKCHNWKVKDSSTGECVSLTKKFGNPMNYYQSISGGYSPPSLFPLLPISFLSSPSLSSHFSLILIG